MSRNRGRPPLSIGPMPAILLPPPPSSVMDSSPPGSSAADHGMLPTGQDRSPYRSDIDEDVRSAASQPAHGQGEFRGQQRDPDTYKAEYGVVRPSPRTGNPAKKVKPKNHSLADSPYVEGELNSSKAEVRSLRMELQDREGRLDLLKIDNDNLIQRLGDARKDRERMEQDIERERREFRDKLREMEKSRPDWKDGPHSRMLDQTVAEKAELADKLRRLEVELTREKDQIRRLQLQASSVGGAGAKNDVMEAELRRYKADVERLENEVRREVMRAEELSSELSSLRHSTVSVGRERDLEAKIDKIQREADSNYKKLQEALTENERLRKNRISSELQQDLNGQIDKLTANIKGKERQIDDLNQEVRKITLAKSELENNNADLQSALSEMKREIQRAKVDVDDAKDATGRELARIRAEHERLKTERDMETFRSPRRVPSDPDLMITSINSPSRTFRPTDGMAGPLQDLVKEQESHIADLRREVESLRGAVSDYQREMERLRVLADDQVMTREKFNDIASAHRRLLDENARLLLMLDKQHQSETRAVTDKTEVVKSLSDAKKRLEAGNRRITQLERWLDEIYNDKDFEVIHKRGAYSKGHICRGAYPQPKAQVPLMLTERRREQIRRLLDESRTATAHGRSAATKSSGYSTDRL